jgi:hypothetical protein
MARIAKRTRVFVVVAFTDLVREATRVSLGISASDSIKVSVTLDAARVITRHVVAGRTSLNILPCPISVSAAARPHARQNPGEDLAGHWSVPGRLKPILPALNSVAIDAVFRFVAGLALPLFANTIQRVGEPVAQIVLSLHGLRDLPPA